MFEFIRKHFRVTRNRVGGILQSISDGSTPGLSYYTLISAAALIASLGLIANSTAVVIGAMLVSPLMTPIFGIALGMIRGNAPLLGKAFRAEVGGVVLAVAFGALLGIVPISSDVTSEMLSRTAPTLLDMLVAVFAGLAGALAVTNDRISPALPGVAISTAIVPPLATCGLCLAYGAYGGAYGAFLLFAANFFAILLVSSLVFALAGLAADEAVMPLQQITRRLAIACICFLVVAVVLTKALVGVIEDRRCEKMVRTILADALRREKTSSLVEIMQTKHENGIDVLATIRCPKVLSPDRVRGIEEELKKSLNIPVRLMARCVLSRDVAPTGTLGTITPPTLDGIFISEDLDPEVYRIQLSEQTLRELFSRQHQLDLQDTDLLYLAGEPVVIATVQAPRLLLPVEISGYESAIRERLHDPHIRLLVRCLVSTDITSRGKILYGAAHFGDVSDEAERVRDQAIRLVRETGDLFVTNADAVWSRDRWNVRAELTGQRTVSPAEIRHQEQELAERVGKPVSLIAWSRTELMVTDSAFMPVETYTEEQLRSRVPSSETSLPLVKD